MSERLSDGSVRKMRTEGGLGWTREEHEAWQGAISRQPDPCCQRQGG